MTKNKYKILRVQKYNEEINKCKRNIIQDIIFTVACTSIPVSYYVLSGLQTNITTGILTVLPIVKTIHSFVCAKKNISELNEYKNEISYIKGEIKR